MRVWLDDVREAPDGWVVKTPEEAIDLYVQVRSIDLAICALVVRQ